MSMSSGCKSDWAEIELSSFSGCKTPSTLICWHHNFWYIKTKWNQKEYQWFFIQSTCDISCNRMLFWTRCINNPVLKPYPLTSWFPSLALYGFKESESALNCCWICLVVYCPLVVSSTWLLVLSNTWTVYCSFCVEALCQGRLQHYMFSLRCTRLHYHPIQIKIKLNQLHLYSALHTTRYIYMHIYIYVLYTCIHTHVHIQGFKVSRSQDSRILYCYSITCWYMDRAKFCTQVSVKSWHRRKSPNIEENELYKNSKFTK